ncbi:periplasmic protein [Polystyrenella longa]|uniref:Periplasmic protein n=1 Tax=Polystyrenella longa TaxID=2528007 RepID=A0A518CGJ9_9PLAN|nr:BON domain-containing protein [Polystyrenella longa]QDU78351.1 periplasmic protein [Polystyrenella longa]
MGIYRKWVLTLGMMAAVPSVATAGDFGFLNNQSADQQAVSPRNNQQVAEEIGQALRGAKLNGFNIEIQYQDGVATLKGKIQSAKQKQTASKILQKIDGVERVDNQLEVIQSAAQTQKPAFRANGGQIQQTAATEADPIASNQKMAQKIANELGKSGLNGYDIEVRFQDGRAQLGGFVGSPQEARQAHIVASNVDGVHQVANGLRIKGEGQPIAQAGMPGGMQPGMGPMGPMGPGMAPGMPGGMPGMPGMQAGGPQINPASFQGSPQMMPIAPSQGQMPPSGAGAVYGSPNLPQHAWPAQAAYPNYAAIQYPKEYSASAFPYIGPFYPYPQVPLGWREVSLEWDDGYWKLDFDSKTDRWYWFLNPKNW